MYKVGLCDVQSEIAFDLICAAISSNSLQTVGPAPPLHTPHVTLTSWLFKHHDELRPDATRYPRLLPDIKY